MSWGNASVGSLLYRIYCEKPWNNVTHTSPELPTTCSYLLDDWFVIRCPVWMLSILAALARMHAHHPLSCWNFMQAKALPPSQCLRSTRSWQARVMEIRKAMLSVLACLIACLLACLVVCFIWFVLFNLFCFCVCFVLFGCSFVRASVRSFVCFVSCVVSRRFASCRVVWLVGWLASWLVGWLVFWSVGQSVRRSVGRSVCCFFCWLAGCLLAWLVGCLVGWLAVCLFVCCSNSFIPREELLARLSSDFKVLNE